MFCRFDSRSRRRRPAQAPAASAVSQPLEPVLSRLVGRPVTLLVGGRQLSGRLLASRPPTLVGPQGQVTVVAQLVKSVAF